MAITTCANYSLATDQRLTVFLIRLKLAASKSLSYWNDGWKGAGGHVRIGQLAKAAGVSVQTIRFYERRGLLRPPHRTASGYRIYAVSDLESLRFVKWCQPMGFTLKELRELLQLHDAVAKSTAPLRLRGQRELASIVQIGQEKLVSIEEKVRLLQDMQHQLRAMIVQLRSTQPPACPASQGRNPSGRATR